MRLTGVVVVLLCVVLSGCGGKPAKPEKIIAQINDYKVTQREFEEAFSQSAYAAREDKDMAREEYLDSLINQKLVLMDAQKKNIDKQKDFLQAIERFWEQSLLTSAVGIKTKEIAASLRIPEDQIRRLYDQMIREGVTTKTYQEMYAQIRWQAEKQVEAQRLNDWMNGLRQDARINVDKSLLKAEK